MSDAPSRQLNLPIAVTIGSLLLLALLGAARLTLESVAIHVAFLLAQTVVISILIWQVCEPFADAAQWIGKSLRLPGSVRGATLDAVASSMPELFAGIFFVIVAVFAVDAAPVGEAAADGFGSAVATCAGSAVYNMILIPALCVIVISYVRRSRPTIDIDKQVLTRDGFWFLVCEIILISFLFMDEMHWWMAIVLFLAYAVYVGKLYFDANRFRGRLNELKSRIASGEAATTAIESMRESGKKISEEMAQLADPDLADALQTADLLFGKIKVRLNAWTAWTVIVVMTLLAAAACYWLVDVTKSLADTLQVPDFFVAVIIAAAASSVPDTFLSIGSARRGDDDGAVSNAFGSNIFDITVCLSIPLLIGCYLNDWAPIPLTQDGEPIRGLVLLRILLCVFSVITLLIMWHRRQLTQLKAWFLCGMYAIFVLYAVGGSLGWFDAFAR